MQSSAMSNALHQTASIVACSTVCGYSSFALLRYLLNIEDCGSFQTCTVNHLNRDMIKT